MKNCLLFVFILTALSSLAIAADRTGRLGAGMSSQLRNGLPAISFKLQKSKSFAFGGLFALNTDEQSGGMGGAIKFYRVIFDEPQLNFYASGLLGLITKKTASISQSGFQVDLTLGSEFSFRGLGSLGFSFEFGLSLNKINNFVVETVGNHFVVAGVHFYL